MPTVFLAPGVFGAGGQFFDANGVPLNAGRIATFAAGTTTPQATYTTGAGTIPNGNPIILNSDGRPPQEMWLIAASGYDVQVVDSVSNLVGGPYNSLYGINDPASNNAIGYTGATISGALTMNLAAINEAQASNVPVAAAINLTAMNGNYASLTGSGTITSLQLLKGAERVFVVSTASCAFQNSANLIMLGGASVTPAVGDILGFRGETPPVVRNVLYQSAAGGVGTTVSSNKVLAGPTLSSASAGSATFRLLSGFDGASWVLLSSGAASASATFEFTNQIDATYDQYAVLMSNVVPSTNTTNFVVQVGKSNGVTYVTVSYAYATFNWNDASASGAAGSAVATSIQLTSAQANAGGQGFGGMLLFEQPANAAHFKRFNSSGVYVTAASNTTQFLSGGNYIGDGGVLDKLRFLFSSGNISTGNFALYGIRKG